MTLSSTASRIRYEGDGATSSFPVPFKFFDSSHVRVTLRDAADQETLWSEGTEYGLTGAGNDSGGTLTVVTAPQDFRPKAGESLVIALVVPFTQEKSFPLGGAFPSTQVEEGFDLAVQRDAQLTEFDRRVMSVPASDTQVGKLELAIDALRAGKYLGFDATGKPTFLAGTSEAADLSDKTVLPTGAGEARSLADLFGLGALTAENVKLHGAKGDLVEDLSDGTVTDGSAVLDSTGTTFVTTDVGKVIWVEGAATTGKTISAAVNGPIDAAWQFDVSEGTFVDETDDLNDVGAGDVEPFPTTEAVGDIFYLGHVQTFNSVTVDIGTPGVGGVVAWEYWDGSAWQALTVTDGTSGFTAAVGNHDITFTPPVDWATTQLNKGVNGRKLFYIRARLTTVYTTNPVLDQATLSGGRVRLTVTDHKFRPEQTVTVKGVVGTTEANGTFQVEHIDPDTLDLIGPSFANAYVSGGTMHGRLETTIASVSGGNATLTAAAGVSISGTAVFSYGTDDTAAIAAALATGKAVVVPQGNYLTSSMEVAAEGQKFIGMGGRLVALPEGLHGTAPDEHFVKVTGNFAEISSLYLDNPTEQASKGTTGNGWADVINRGVGVRAFRVKVRDNIVRRFRDGIHVRTSEGFSTGPEYEGTIIHGNIVWETLGGGSGVANSFTHSGEDRGDGITSWGAAAIISNNIVHVKRGNDARIGIHFESLGDRFDVDNPVAIEPNTGCTITGNIVLAYGVDTRNGRWRRGIFSEVGRHTTIVGNVIYGGGWWAIGTTFAGSKKGSVSITGNSVFWTRPAVDLAGDSFNPTRAAIAVWGNSASGRIDNVAVANNNIEVEGDLSDGILVSNFVSTADREGIRIVGNGVRSAEDGRFTTSALRVIFAANDVVIANNVFLLTRLLGGVAALRIQSGQTHCVIQGNVVAIENSASGINCMELSGGSAVITGNSFKGGDDGCHLINMTAGCIFTGNLVDSPNDDGLNAFGTDNITVTGNVFRNIPDQHLTFFTPSATKIDSANVKN